MRTLVAAALVAGLVGLTRADEKRPGTPAEQIAAIQKEFDKTLKDANAKLRTADAKDKAEVVKTARETFGKLVKEANDLAEKNADNPAVHAPALAFVAGRAGYTPDGAKMGPPALATVKEKYLDKAGIAVALPTLARGPGGVETLKKVVATNKDRTVLGVATFMLGSQLADQSDRAGSKAAAQEAEALLAKVEKEYKDVELDGQPLGTQVADKLYLLRNLAVGKTAPDVEGTNLDGKKVKLSSYRGKVVVLDIWATWCGPCKAMIPHEREMVKKLENKPFVLVSISADAKKETLTEFLKKEEMPWTHWWDGQSGPITKAYKVEFFPNIYVIDAKGVIRHKHIRGEQLEKAVEELIKEAEGSKN